MGVKIKRDMTTLSGKIAVMQHFLNGGKVEYTSIGQNYWADYVEPSWNWALFDYRIKEEPKEYEIFSFKANKDLKASFVSKNAIAVKIKSNHFCYLLQNYTEEMLLNNECWDINSVKRLSDNEIFAIGDRVKQSNVIHDNSFTITGFKLDVNNKHLLVLGNGGIRLSKIEKVKEQLFITQDGAKLYQGDEYYQITPNYEIHKCTALDKSNFDNNIIVFVNKSNAENHVLMNKTCLSIIEICPVIGQCNNNTHIDLDKLTEKLKKLVESK